MNPPAGWDQWWVRPDLGYRDCRLFFAGQDLAEFHVEEDLPAFLYSRARFADNLQRLLAALEGAGLGGRSRVLYAMKANRFAPLLRWLAGHGRVGIDACSPAEVVHAMACGFPARDISLTATSLSRSDLAQLAAVDGLRVNLDSLTALAAWGRLKPGGTVGIRINPAAGVSREGNERLQYAGAETTKFGIYREQFEEALAVCAAHGLRLGTLHLHTGCGYLDGQLPAWEAVLAGVDWFLDRTPGLETLNVGGGLGVPHVAGDAPLDLARWAAVLRRRFGGRNLCIEVEPGEYLAKDAGVLLLECTYDEPKRDQRHVGVNAGFNIAPEPAYYGLPFQPLPVRRADVACTPAVVAGNINEALDVWYRDAWLPPLEPGAALVLINAGAYSSSMASNHCMRGKFAEYLVD